MRVRRWTWLPEFCGLQCWTSPLSHCWSLSDGLSDCLHQATGCLSRWWWWWWSTVKRRTTSSTLTGARYHMATGRCQTHQQHFKSCLPSSTIVELNWHAPWLCLKLSCMARNWDRISRKGLDIALAATSLGFHAAKFSTRLGVSGEIESDGGRSTANIAPHSSR